jgi:hypothetical protein
MAGITIYLSILTVYVNGFSLPSKDINWQAGLKSKTDNLLFTRNPPQRQKQMLA